MALRYWISNTGENWDSTSNWSTISGGPGGASVPSLNDTAIFDGSGVGSCTIDIPINIFSLQIQNTYSSNDIVQGSNQIIIGDGGALFDQGTFQGGTADITSSGPVIIRGCGFTSTSSVFLVKNSFGYFGTAVNPSYVVDTTAQFIEEIFTLNIDNIIDKFVELQKEPAGAEISLNVIGGTAQNYGTDFTSSTDVVSWAGLNLENLLEVGDKIRIFYSTSGISGGFFNPNSGLFKFSLITDSSFNANGITFSNLELNSETNPTIILMNGVATVEKTLTLSKGYLDRGITQELKVLGDTSCLSTFGSIDSGHDGEILIMGDSSQNIYNETGGIFPFLVIDKTTSDKLTAYGTGPIRINKDFILLDGTFNTRGLDIKVGMV